METRIQKSCYGTWMAETITPLNDKLHLCLTTMKRFDGNITTTVNTGKKENYFFVYDPFANYKKTLLSSSERCTKPAVERNTMPRLPCWTASKPKPSPITTKEKHHAELVQ
jgi:hypothetical protein